MPWNRGESTKVSASHTGGEVKGPQDPAEDSGVGGQALGMGAHDDRLGPGNVTGAPAGPRAFPFGSAGPWKVSKSKTAKPAL